MGEEKKRLVISDLGCADGCGRQMGAENSRTAADGVGARGCGWTWVPGCGWKWVGRRSGWRSASLAVRTAADGKWVRRIARTAANGVGATEWLEMGGEKKPLVMCELSCADGCGREMGSENCADGCGRRGCKGVAIEMGEEKKPLVMSELGCADGRGREMGSENCAHGCGRRGCKGVAEMGEEKKPLGMSELGCADGCGLRGRLRTAWVRGSGWNRLEMGGETKALEMRERGCADGCGREMGGENFADGCGRRGCKGVAGNGWGEEAAGDERAWLLRTGNGWGELRGRLRTAWVQRSGWKWVGRRTRCSPRTRMLTRMLMYMQSLSTIFCNSLFEQSCIYIFPL